MFKKILLATDGSTHADRAALKAVELVKDLEQATVTLFHVRSKVDRNSLIQSNFNVTSLLREEAHKAIIKTELLFKREGVPFELAVEIGDPAEEIVSKAEREGYDLIIVGCRGLNKLKELVIGSVSNKVAHDAKCPVMIIK